MGNPRGVKRDFVALERRRFEAVKLFNKNLNNSEIGRRLIRSGILTCSGRYLAAGSSTVTSLRFTMSANSSEVKTLETDPISKIVSPSSGRGSPLARLPQATTRRPLGSM